MPNSPQINLDIRFGGSSDPGWVDVAASNGQVYGYCYTGGTDGAGNVHNIVGQGRDVVPLRLNADRRYQIAGCTITDDPNHQVTWVGTSPYAGTIIDANTAVANAKYTMNITDTGNGNCNIPCDPRVTNVEPA